MRVLVHVVLFSTVLVLPLSFISAAEKVNPADQAAQISEIARLDGEEIHLHDLNYDLKKRWDLDLQAMKVKLYREQKAALQGFIDQRLLEKEAAKRNITTGELIAMINARAEEKAKAVDADKEILFQEFAKKMQHDFPSFSRRPDGLSPSAAVEGLLLPGNGLQTPFIEEIKNKVVEMKKASCLNDTKEVFLQALRDQARIEILLERPPLLRLDLAPDDDPWLGSDNAPITITAFIDFQCPYCKKVSATLKDLLAKKKEGIRIVARNFPLPSHPEATMAAQAAACADDQGRYWDYHDLLFDNQQKLDIESLREYAGRLGLDSGQFSRCLDDGNRKAEVDKNRAEAALAGISGTPGIFINGYYLPGSPSLRYLEEVIADLEKGHIPLVEEDPGKG